MTARILVVDDNRANLRLISYLLDRHGFVVQTASDASTGLASLRQFQPDLILMDIQLPGMDGLELTRLLKANVETRHIKVLALTAYAMKGDEERALQAGCDGYLTKPVNTRALPGVIREALQRLGPEETA